MWCPPFTPVSSHSYFLKLHVPPKFYFLLTPLSHFLPPHSSLLPCITCFVSPSFPSIFTSRPAFSPALSFLGFIPALYVTYFSTSSFIFPTVALSPPPFCSVFSFYVDLNLSLSSSFCVLFLSLLCFPHYVRVSLRPSLSSSFLVLLTFSLFFSLTVSSLPYFSLPATPLLSPFFHFYFPFPSFLTLFLLPLSPTCSLRLPSPDAPCPRVATFPSPFLWSC